MAEKSTFFNSVSGDRKYKAEDMAAHFAKLITSGVYPAGTQLQATEDTGMNVTVSAGSAWINGYAYHNDSGFTLTFDAADGVLNRIDRIIVRWNRLARSINLAIVKGTPGSSPTAPAIVRSADYYDLGIATVSINAGITAITQAMITDTRLDSDVCGFVSSLIQPDTVGWFTQFDSAFTTAINANQSAWDTWFASIEDILDENVAANLLNLINANSTAIADLSSLAAGKGASLVGVQDSAGHFTGTNVESVLAELFTFANDGKTGIANAVTAKGVSASSSDTFATLATKIGQIATVPAMSAGESVLYDSGATPSTAGNSVTYVKVFAAKITGQSGVVRTKFDLAQTYGGGYYAYGKIYKNGVAVGTERSTSSSTYQTFTEDITFNDGDIIAVYGKLASSGQNSMKNFKLCFAPIASVTIA